jgi:putative membrane protein
METAQHPDFSTPQRQSKVAIGIILIKFIRMTVRAFWPILLSFFIGGRNNSSFEEWLGYLAIGFAAFNLIGSILTYFRFYFHLENDAIVIKKGLLKRTHTNIPFERIQTINFKQNILHQIFNVVSVEIDTAGAKKSEISIDALKKDDAEALREFILAEKDQIIAENAGEESDIPQEKEPEKSERILHLKPIDLLKVGVSQNHLRSMGIIFAFVFTTVEQFTDDWTDTVANQVDQYNGFLPENTFLIFLISAILVLIISFLFSLVNTVLKYYDLSLSINKNGLKIVRGLFNREEISINKSKVQIISWSENPIRRMFKLYTLQIEQASSAEASQLKSKIRVPGSYMEQVTRVVTTVFPKEFFRDELRYGVSIHLKHRLFFFLGILPALLLGTVLWFSVSWQALYALLLLPAVWYMVTLYYRKRSFELNSELLRNNAGIFGNSHDLMQIHKVQAVRIKQSWYQHRKSLASVQLFTAAGHITIPFIRLELAQELENYILYRAESDGRKWM